MGIIWQYISPFKTGHGIALQTNGSSSKYVYSNVNTQVKSQSVYLSDAIGPGSFWEVIVLANNRIRLKLMISYVQILAFL